MSNFESFNNDEESHIPVSEQMQESVSNENTEDMNNEYGMNIEGYMSRAEIEESISQIIRGIEEKRKQDKKFLEDAVKEIMAQAKRSCEILEQHMLQMHTARNKELDEELEKALNVLDNTKQVEVELEMSKSSLHTLCQEIQKSII